MEAHQGEEGAHHDPAPLGLVIGRNVRRLRGRDKQATVARACGVSQSTIARIEQGQRLPAVDLLLALADYFGVTMDALVREPPAS